MNKELLLDMFYAAPELWYAVLAVICGLSALSGFFYYNILKLRQKNYFIKRSCERYAETINAAKDGYYIFVYPDDRINDPRQNVTEHCSRRLAVILGLPAGIDSGFEDVLRHFYKDDSEKIYKYTALLRDDGVSFEDKFVLKNGKTLNLSGARISGADGSVYGDIIWFRDISGDAGYIDSLLLEQKKLKERLCDFEDMVDNLPYPVWLRSPSLDLTAVNKKYAEFAGCADRASVLAGNVEIDSGSDEKSLKALAVAAQESNRPQVQSISRNFNGRRFCFEACETPFHSEESLDKIATVGTLLDISELDELKHNLKQHQNAHLEILGALGTAFAVFDGSLKLSFYNQAFKALWQLDDDWFESEPAYGRFLDNLRERRLLPEVPDYHPNDEGESPLSKATDWVNTTCPKCGGKARRETDVMPNWAGSSWYFLRYCDPHNDKEFASKEALDYWMNVDWYNGGMEHTTLHLLYSRFWHKFLYDCGCVPTKEPYNKRTSHGMILASNGEKMSKSRGNVINPDDIVNTYGADTFRLYEMFIGPFDQVAMWSEESLMGVYRFVGKIYGLFKKVAAVKPSADDLRAMHKCILEVTERIDGMKFNTAVSSLMTYVNYLAGMEQIPQEMYENLMKLLSPFAPHLSEEMWARMGKDTLVLNEPWPQGDTKLAEDNVVTLAVQICGKMRGTIEMPKNAPQADVEQKALALENVARQLEGRAVKKIIVVPNRIVNIVA